MTMAALLTAACLGLLAGWVMRSELARARARQAAAAVARARRQAARHRARAQALSRAAEAGREALALSGQLGGDGWLLGALRAVHAEFRPGKQAERLDVGVRFKATHDRVCVGAERGGGVERHVLMRVTDGESIFDSPELVDFPSSPDSPGWVTG